MIGQMIREEVRSLGHDIDGVFKELHVPVAVEGKLVQGVNSTLRVTQHLLATAGSRADAFLKASAASAATAES
jgi:hypothetical protein